MPDTGMMEPTQAGCCPDTELVHLKGNDCIFGSVEDDRGNVRYGMHNGFGNIGRKGLDDRGMVADCDGLKTPGTSKAFVRGLMMPFSRGGGGAITDVLLLDNNGNGGTRNLPTPLTNLTADWSTGMVAPPTGRSKCETTGIFGRDKPNGREFLAMWGIPTPVAGGKHDWSGALAPPTGRSG